MDKVIRQLRPRLSEVSPLVHWTAAGFVWLNIWLSHIIWSAPQPRLTIYNNVLTQQFWAIAFLVLSAGIVYGIFSNRWQVVRYSLIAGLFVKAVFLYALVALAFQTSLNAVEGTLALWLFLVWVQVGAVIFFLPPILKGDGDGK